MTSADTPLGLTVRSPDATKPGPSGVVEDEVGHAGAGTVDGSARRVTARLASRLAWLRGFVRIETDARAIAALDGIRGLAASLVFIVHYQAAFGRLLGDHPAAQAAGRYAALVGY